MNQQLDWQLQTPIVLVVFNRPDTTAKVFEAIRKVRPAKLFVIADGPRTEHNSEIGLCEATRDIVRKVDWDCETFYKFSEVNLGCKQAVSSGLNWVFNNVEEAIILEDDCLPHPNFFHFCENLLRKYRHDERILSISGTNFMVDWKSSVQSYHFSYFFNCWGWASWRRAWKLYDAEMKLWSNPNVQERVRDRICDPKQYEYCQKFFDATYAGRTKSWAYQYSFMLLAQSGLSIFPARNLISNIGFGKLATNTSTINDIRANLPIFPIKFPLKEPLAIAVDRDYDRKRYEMIWDDSLSAKIRRKVKRLIKAV